MKRRTVLLGTTVAVGGATGLAGSLWHQAFADPAQPGPSPYGDLLEADANGIRLPEGFTSRAIGESSKDVAGYTWHDAPDGGACFETEDGWIYVSNSEIENNEGGASAVRFTADGEIHSAYRILGGTERNCAGGATPWGTWLSCEETERGEVYETDPTGEKEAVVHPAMGRFQHEAAACDPDRKVVYLTEDESDGCFYRFTPDNWEDLSAGRLDVLTESDGTLAWEEVPDPLAEDEETRFQVSSAKKFDGGEGCWYTNGICYFTTKGSNTVWAFNAADDTIAVAYDDDEVDGDAPLHGVDNITGARSGDLFVAEDGGDMEINIITPDEVVAPFLRIEGHDESEICGPAFSPDGKRFYFSSQRGSGGSDSDGITYEVTGPFRDSA
ncbi:alkaline phosphatase PhoX [Stackebrandtia nassauensis]|uniref:WD40 domain protein beta Propeller n=1 Tax=Stackebrandtia nassauensis (strain DSM 44728 / CIP 108903 / NRRL B-16338 / NBRC 102104 / LLR-40K-21) TaxID=446470 RepID=D3PZ03_STANL|nr:alkaline phosphatase PhoX [Stackebrandtia nassauensis]ADD45432.1 protein of unknown function DUF839 [Stackebrandtia nassauensis DSM 44728]